MSNDIDTPTHVGDETADPTKATDEAATVQNPDGEETPITEEAPAAAETTKEVDDPNAELRADVASILKNPLHVELPGESMSVLSSVARMDELELVAHHDFVLINIENALGIYGRLTDLIEQIKATREAILASPVYLLLDGEWRFKAMKSVPKPGRYRAGLEQFLVKLIELQAQIQEKMRDSAYLYAEKNIVEKQQGALRAIHHPKRAKTLEDFLARRRFDDIKVLSDNATPEQIDAVVELVDAFFEFERGQRGRSRNSF